MKPLLTLLSVLLFVGALEAQTPVISDNTGLPPAADIQVISYGNSLYVAAEPNGLIFTSSNGVAWHKTANLSATVSSVQGLAFGAGTFVISGGNGYLASSTDGVTWTTRTSGTTNNLNDIEFLDGAFYAAGDQTTLLTSTNGTTWSPLATNVGTPTDMFVNVDFGNGLLVISAQSQNNGGTAVYSYTPSTSTWNYTSIDPTQNVNKVQYIKDKFWLFTSASNIYTSTDAATWTNSTPSLTATMPDNTTQSLGSPNQIYAGFYDGSSLYFLGSTSYYPGGGAVFTSTDEANFTLLPEIAILPSGGKKLNSTYFVYGGQGWVSSTDGNNFLSSGTNYYGLATNNNTNYVGVGYNNIGQIFSSPDFSTWTSRTPPNLADLTAIAWNGSEYLAVGNQTVISSASGSGWTTVSTPAQNFNSLAYGAGLFVAGASDPNTQAGTIQYSSDGINWTTANTEDNLYYKIKFVNNTFFALGAANVSTLGSSLGVILMSTDGINWTDITPVFNWTVSYFNDVVYNNSTYYFMGMQTDPSYNPVGFFSAGTTTPTNPYSFSTKGTITSPPSGVILGGTFGDGAFTTSNNRLVGTVIDVNSGYGYLIWTTDGMHWSNTPLNEISSVFGITANNDIYSMLGTGGGTFSANFSGTLPVTWLDFNAVAQGHQSNLTWHTASEQNSSHFIVEHSTDGAAFTSIGTVAAAGQSTGPKSYSFIDPAPVAGNNYYRLDLVDLDGQQHYSTIKNVYFGPISELLVYPNPAHDATTVLLPRSGSGILQLYSAAGMLVREMEYSGNIINLPLSNLSAGIYHLVVVSGSIRYEHEIICR